MILGYPSHLGWTKTVSANYLAELGASNQKRLRAMLKHLQIADITHTIEPLTEELVAWFTPLYQETIGEKENAHVFNIRETTLDKKGVDYFMLRIFENGTPLGATIFSKRTSSLSVAYRVFQTSWNTHDFAAGPTLYAEYLTVQHAYESGYTKLSHRNPYGLNAAIGLASFKLSFGCVPLAAKSATTETLDTDALETDILVVVPVSEGNTQLKGILLTTRENEQKYLQVTKYPDALPVTVVYREQKAG